MKTFVIFLLTLGSFPIFAQSDSQITELEKTLQVQIDSLGEEHLDIAMYCDRLGELYMKVGKYAQADSLFTKALDIKVKKLEENHTDITDSYDNLGKVHYFMGDYKNAIVFFNKTLNIRLEILDKKHPDLAQSYNSLGVLYAITGDYENAIVFFNKALDINIEKFGEEHANVAKSYNNLGNIYQQSGNYEKAITFHNKALNIWSKTLGEKHPDLTKSYNNLGTVYEKTGDHEKAIIFHNKALNIRLDILGEKHPDVGTSYSNLGVLYSKTNNYEKAITFHHKALNIWLETLGEKHYNVATSYDNLGFVYKAVNPQKAVKYYNKALNIWLETLGERHPDIAMSYKNLAMAYEESGNYKKADSLWHIAIPQSSQRLKSTYLFLPNNQRIKYSNISGNDDFYSFAAINGIESTKQLATNLLLNTKSLALDYAVSTNQLIKKTNDTTLIAQHQQLNKLNKQLADVETLSNEERKEKGWDLAEIQEEQEALAFQMLQHPQLKFKLNIKTIEWQDVQNHLALDEATVDFLRVYEKKDSLWTYYAVVIQDTANPQFVRVTDEDTLTKLLETDEEERPGYLHNSKTRKALHKTLWQSLELYLEGVKTVHISPSGVLHRVPFECFQDEAGEYLAARYAFHYHAAIRDMLKEKSQKNTYEDMLVMGHILYDLDDKAQYQKAENVIAIRDEERSIRDGIRPLPATLSEVNKIDKTAKKAGLKTTLLTIDAASEDTVQHFVGERAPSIMHFATHGVFLPPLEKPLYELDTLTGSRDRLRAADNPLQRSALMLYGANETWTKGRHILGSGEDGILTALEVTALDLQNTDLVVLSACSTGLGNVHNTEGVFGLQRAFKLAGADYVVASLWAVDDTATKELMVLFYENLLQKKQDPATALRNAKETLRKEGYLPQYWAGFILIE